MAAAGPHYITKRRSYNNEPQLTLNSHLILLYFIFFFFGGPQIIKKKNMVASSSSFMAQDKVQNFIFVCVCVCRRLWAILVWPTHVSGVVASVVVVVGIVSTPCFDRWLSVVCIFIL